MGLFDFFKKSSTDSTRGQPQVFSRDEVVKERQKQSERVSRQTIDALFGRDEAFYEIAELNRRATACGDAGQLDEAVACLQKVAELNKAFIQSSPSEGVRLALYLQKAGRGVEAIDEMERLIATVPAAVDACMSNGRPSPASDKDRFEANQYATLYDKLRLIMQREKRKSEADEYRQLAQRWNDSAGALYQRQVMKATVDVPARPSFKK